MGMKKYPKLRYPGEEETRGLFADGNIFVQEKLDGGNARFTLEKNLEEQFHTDERAIAFGTRNNVYKNPKDETNQFEDSMEYVRSNVDEQLLRWYDDSYGGIIVFGEYMEPHTIQGYNWDTWKGTFIGFDVWSIGSNEFVEPHKALELIEDIGLPTAPIIADVTVEQWESGNTPLHDDGDWPEDTSWCPDSNFGDVQAEGVVLKNPTTETYAKLVREDFKEKNNKTFGKPKKYQKGGAEKLSYQYIPNARIRKAAHRLVDEGEWDSLQMNMMQDLPEAAIRDMADEEAGNIFMYENWDVDIGQFRSVTSSRCAKVLRKMINERAKSDL